MKKLFGSSETNPTTPLYSAKHPAAKEISEAEQAALERLNVSPSDYGTTVTLNTADYADIKRILDRAIEKAPNDPDLLYARASLHYLFLQGEDGAKDRDACLALSPKHFDAIQKKQHFHSWDAIFSFPGWDEHQTTVSDTMMKHIEKDHTVQVVRDHLRLAVAIVIPESRTNLNGASLMRWDLKWSSTPHGFSSAHYLFLNNGQFQEFFLPPFADDEPRIPNGYWLLRRLASETFCFIVITNGRSVVRNERYVFPTSLRQVLAKMGSDLESSGPTASMQQFQSAAQWYMQNSDVSALKF